LNHAGACFRNSKNGLSVTEEYATEKIGSHVLIDPKTNKLRPDIEAILCQEIIAGIDTKGSKRMIKLPSEIIPES
jgi:hypothetical protein